MNHVKEILGDKLRFKCLECTNVFCNKQMLEDHIKASHTDVKEFVCENCYGKFRTAISYKRHCESEHGQTHPYKCKECGTRFTLESSLNTHFRTHQDKRPFQCSECDASFKQSSSLKYHLQRHGDESNYTCDICSKSFKTKNDLSTHKKIHNPNIIFKCDICLKQFNRKANYQRHLKQHDVEKPFNCPYCPKGFYRKEPFEQHLRIHTNDKPFSCNECGMNFNDKRNLNKHKKTHLKVNQQKTSSAMIIRRIDKINHNPQDNVTRKQNKEKINESNHHSIIDPTNQILDLTLVKFPHQELLSNDYTLSSYSLPSSENKTKDKQYWNFIQHEPLTIDKYNGESSNSLKNNDFLNDYLLNQTNMVIHQNEFLPPPPPASTISEDSQGSLLINLNNDNDFQHGFLHALGLGNDSESCNIQPDIVELTSREVLDANTFFDPNYFI